LRAGRAGARRLQQRAWAPWDNNLAQMYDHAESTSAPPKLLPAQAHSCYM